MEETFDEMRLMNNTADIIDESVIERNGMMMYGSKKLTSLPYLIQKEDHDISGVYIANISPQHVIRYAHQDFLKPYGQGFQRQILLRKLSLRNSNALEVVELNATGENLVTYNLALKEQSEKQIIQRKHNLSENENFAFLQSEEEFQYLWNLVDLLNPERAYSRDSWIEVGWTLYNIDYRLLPKWIEFSKNAKGYENTAEYECSQEWSKMKVYNKKLGFLIHMVNIDSPNELKKYRHCDSLDRKIKMVLDACHGKYRLKVDEKTKRFKPEERISRDIKNCINDIVAIMVHSYNDVLTCSNFDSKTWFYFDGVRWVKDKGLTAHKIVNTDMIYLFSDYTSKYEEYLRNMQGEEDTFVL